MAYSKEVLKNRVKKSLVAICKDLDADSDE